MRSHMPPGNFLVAYLRTVGARHVFVINPIAGAFAERVPLSALSGGPGGSLAGEPAVY